MSARSPDEAAGDEKDEVAGAAERRLVEETASQLEQQLVHSVYEEIAGHFSDTRHKPWPRVAAFIQVLQRGGSWWNIY